MESIIQYLYQLQNTILRERQQYLSKDFKEKYSRTILYIKEYSMDLDITMLLQKIKAQYLIDFLFG